MSPSQTRLIGRGGWRPAVLGAAAWALLGGVAAGQARVSLTVRPTSITFPTADPDVAPVVTAPALDIRYQVRNNAGQAWRITVLASGDLIAGGSVIDIGNISWTATPTPPFQAGTLSKTLEQTVASGFGNIQPPQNGTLVFQLNNLWSYSVGVYTQNIIFTLSAP